jgi:hypothetical protein
MYTYTLYYFVIKTNYNYLMCVCLLKLAVITNTERKHPNPQPFDPPESMKSHHPGKTQHCLKIAVPSETNHNEGTTSSKSIDLAHHTTKNTAIQTTIATPVPKTQPHQTNNLMLPRQ